MLKGPRNFGSAALKGKHHPYPMPFPGIDTYDIHHAARSGGDGAGKTLLENLPSFVP